MGARGGKANGVSLPLLLRAEADRFIKLHEKGGVWKCETGHSQRPDRNAKRCSEFWVMPLSFGMKTFRRADAIHSQL